MRLVWLTDVHLNFVTRDRVNRLLLEIEGRSPDAVLVAGDISESGCWEDWLHQWDAHLQCPIYFVLGNHDYYGGSIAKVRARATELTAEQGHIGWLPALDVVPVGENTALIGHDGWGDARAAEFLKSEIVLNDYFHIEELRSVSGRELAKALTPELEAKLKKLGDETAAHFSRVLPFALESAKHVIVLTHVPPFREACVYEGGVSDDNWAPHFCCIAGGEVLAETMRNHLDHRMTVLCGHTHGEGRAEILPNLTVITGPAEYGDPRVQDVIETE